MQDETETGETSPETTRWQANPRAIAAGLHFLATPIGAARDITLRALDLLAGADVIAAEDTRTLRHLMEIHGVPLNGRYVIAYHDHNGAEARPRILQALAAGKSVAYASEAGTPLVADPGYQLGRLAIENGYPVFAAPGPSAVLAALTVSGLPTDRFLFAGFPPNTASARRKWLTEFEPVPATLVFYESPKRLNAMLTDLVTVFGGDRQAAVCRELTKRFEEIRRGSLQELSDLFDGQSIKGELVVLIDRARGSRFGPEEIEAMLREKLAVMRVKDAAKEVSDEMGLARRDVYQLALKLTSGDGEADD